jgi:glycosyltransferase involved in cell wall biosynthesis
VVVVTTSFPRSEDDPSGHFVRSSAEALARGGDEIHVIAPGGSMRDPPSREGRLTVHRAGGGALFGWPGAAARAREAPWRLLAAGPFAAGVLKRLRDLGPVDRAVAHWIIPCAWPLMLRGPRVPLEVRAHGADVRLLLRSPMRSRDAVIGGLLERGARFTFAARALLDALSGALSPAVARTLAAAAHVEPPAIDVPEVAPRARALRERIDLAPGERLAVTACRLIAPKRVDLAIAAARAASPPVRLVVVGGGPERPALERLAAPPAVQLVGALPRREALAWIAAADVLLHLSSIEAAPTAVREARALGVPVIACDAGDVSSWAADDPGIAIAEPSVEAIVAALGGIARRDLG